MASGWRICFCSILLQVQSKLFVRTESVIDERMHCLKGGNSVLGRDFSGTNKFIQRIEGNITQFYDLVGQHLRAWQPPAPKPVNPIVGSDDNLAEPQKSNASDSGSE